MNLKKQLQLYIEREGLNTSQLARKADVPNATIADWLAGRKPRNFDQVKKVADVLKVTIDHLLYGDGVRADSEDEGADLDALLGDGWVGGLFEVRLRRVKKKGQ